MKKKLFSILIVGILQQYNAQVGINTELPASTLEVVGSIQGKYTEITTTSYTILSTDYHLSYAGTANTVFTLPSQTTLLNNNTDFRGRKYFIKNNSTNSEITVNAAANQLIRFGGGKASTNNFIIKPGNSAIVTASNSGWDLDFVASTATPNNWMLYDTSLDGYVNGSTHQTITAVTDWGTPAYDTLIKPNSPLNPKPPVEVKVTVPPSTEYSKNRVVLNFVGWGDALVSEAARGSLRFFIKEIKEGTAPTTTITTTVMMTSWSTMTSTVNGIRYNFPVNFVIENKAPGTYTYQLLVSKEDESTTTATTRIWTLQAKAEVYVKND